ncbi:hypothetical protein PGTUg99_014331 [Puccinia graminis f. sp. tritici]|uniref:Uncharacterized protein n=1 Tax=Puccinia graminis f. sp. tritici TaxID=56615 RepID=A0A5B0RDH8_PUCGR|nr:hypothetical protein PGTUg99_014331 [Puccinia graminis f. sp. tritici]
MACIRGGPNRCRCDPPWSDCCVVSTPIPNDHVTKTPQTELSSITNPSHPISLNPPNQDVLRNSRKVSAMVSISIIKSPSSMTENCFLIHFLRLPIVVFNSPKTVKNFHFDKASSERAPGSRNLGGFWYRCRSGYARRVENRQVSNPSPSRQQLFERRRGFYPGIRCKHGTGGCSK